MTGERPKRWEDDTHNPEATGGSDAMEDHTDNAQPSTEDHTDNTQPSTEDHTDNTAFLP